MTLDKYWQKRDFFNTPEPRGEVVKSDQELSFFIQRHHARRLHYDFRLELNGTLKSWAVPKGPSLNPADKRLAVHVEDHPLEYGTFEGDIPAHQYGAGHVVLWDRGTWTPIGDPEDGYKKGNLKFLLQGLKLQGKWVLVRMGKPADEGKENWLLIKEKDEEARTDEDANITDLRPESVKDKKPKASSKSGIKSKAGPSAKTKAGQTQTLSVKVPMPEFLNPQLATLVAKAPAGNQWLSEIKYDGYRALSRIDHSKVQIFTRAGNDWTKKWPVIAEAITALAIDQAWLDGEVVALDEDGAISFQALQNYHSTKLSMTAKGKTRLLYYVFDLLYLNGQDISDLPQADRKALLKELLSTLPPDSPVMYSDHIIGNAAAVFEDACKNGLEGIVVKQADAPYSQTRSPSWQKVKCVTEQEFVIGGYTDPEGSRQGFGAIVLGVYDSSGKFIYAGRVGTGFNSKNIPEMSKRFAALEINAPAFDKPPKGQDARGVHWLKPDLVAEVKFAQWTDANVIRHASFIALREDKPPQEVIREQALNNKAQLNKVKTEEKSEMKTSRPAAKPQSAEAAINSKDEASVAGVRISHSSKIIFSERKETKLDLALYYQAIENWLMPHLEDRPLSLLRCPQGNEKECFFQKNYNDSSPDQIQKIKVPSSDGAVYMMANDLPAVIGLVQMGVLELHTWGSKKGNLNKPDRIIMDLDPDPELPWTKVIEGAQLVKFLFENIGLASFLKTTGGKGLHIVVPIQPELDFAVIKAFTKSIAEHLSATAPDYFIAVMSKAKRTNKIFLDYLRNGVDATAIAAYSTRARPDASISAPIRWEELNEDLHADAFNLSNIQDRLSHLKKDPWADYFSTRQRVTAKMIQIFSKD